MSRFTKLWLCVNSTYSIGLGFHQREGIQLARIARVAQRTEVAPIELPVYFSGRRLHAHEGAAG